MLFNEKEAKSLFFSFRSDDCFVKFLHSGVYMEEGITNKMRKVTTAETLHALSLVKRMSNEKTGLAAAKSETYPLSF